MAKTLFFGICLLFFLFFFSTPSLAQKTGFAYTGFDSATANLTLKDYARIGTDRILRLTNITSRLKGYAFHPTALRFKDGSNNNSAFSFSTAFAFAIVPQVPNLGGHGFAFALAPSLEFKGAHPSQYLGLLNASDNGNFSNHIVAVEFDTVQDFEFGDINDNHVGIDINSMASNATVSAGDTHLQSGKTIQAWVDYDGENKVFNVSFAMSSTKPPLSNLSFPVDLSPYLNDEMYVGFSASTGLLASSHYIMGWNFQMNGKAASLDLSALPSLPKPKKKSTSFIIGASTAAAFIMGILISAAVYLFKKIKNADVIEPWEREYANEHHKGGRGGAVVPARGVGSGGAPPGREGEQRAAGLGDEREAGGLRAGPAVRARDEPAHDARGGNAGVPGPRADSDGEGDDEHGRVRLRGGAAGGGVRAASHRGEGAAGGAHPGGLGVGAVAGGEDPGDGGSSAGGSVPGGGGGAGPEAGPPLLPPGGG
ncbi:hypothetical protein H6P81_007492 [Aristolochia fimbriata]|uniref:non-specific serine/threonine protein kinase n=1 Tax=Aristolochia fimbriata TaxID=158543 RepID=A0AAV7F0Q8_ARIFI|nr:hypothetical protein H6P81_007492 [Aristolochia fimbriata]